MNMMKQSFLVRMVISSIVLDILSNKLSKANHDTRMIAIDSFIGEKIWFVRKPTKEVTYDIE